LQSSTYACLTYFHQGIYVHTYIYTYTHACIYTYIHTWTHTYMYTYIHICIHWGATACEEHVFECECACTDSKLCVYKVCACELYITHAHMYLHARRQMRETFIHERLCIWVGSPKTNVIPSNFPVQCKAFGEIFIQIAKISEQGNCFVSCLAKSKREG
jgi:hypothetical protein